MNGLLSLISCITWGLEKNVHALGFMSDPLPYYAAGNIYLRTNLFESENLSSYVAMAMGASHCGI